MATYPGPYDGAYPIDGTTDVGKVRLLVGDTEGTEYTPAQAGHRNYEAFSDAQLQAFIDQGGSVNSGVGFAYLQLAGSAAGGVDWASDDLRVTMSKTSGQLLDIAQFWFGKDSGSGADIYELAQIGQSDEFLEWPEGATRPGWWYTPGYWSDYGVTHY